MKRDGIHGGQSMPLIPGGVDLVPGPERYDLPPPLAKYEKILNCRNLKKPKNLRRKTGREK